MNRLQYLTLWALIIWIALGTSVLIYFQKIDGVFINKPITFSVDTQALPVEHAVYHRGDPIKVEFSYCRNRTYSTRTTWKLINETVVTYPEVQAVLKPECVQDKWVTVGAVPEFAVPGKHHLEGLTQIQINPANIIYQEYKSVDFQVI